jgi:group I intron endonuclease
MAQIGVYVLFCKVTKKMYVGSSQELDKRIHRHFHELKNNIHHNSQVQEVWNQHHQLTVNIIPVDTIEIARAVEQSVIEKNIHLGNLLNIGASVIGGDNLTHNPRREDIIKQIKETLGENIAQMSQNERTAKFGKLGEQNGMYGKTHSPEARAKMSQANLGHTRNKGIVFSEQHRANISAYAKTRTGEKNPFYGKKMSEETKAKLLKANLGKVSPNRRQLSIDGVVYESLTAASKALGIGMPTILFRIKSNSPKFANYFYL